MTYIIEHCLNFWNEIFETRIVVVFAIGLMKIPEANMLQLGDIRNIMNVRVKWGGVSFPGPLNLLTA
ncbi:hypothetical protein [Undibacterium sp. Ji49W]|uniref:hypothetical protein n=1 Tax=Undibacterium sp. Ji49W TaxID=3413040 RepID=UPI003BF2732B